MKDQILNFPKQFEEGLEIADPVAEKLPQDKAFNQIIVTGMGASAWPADILNLWLNLKLPFYVNRNYGLLRKTEPKTLLICVSYSGNTEETISTYKEGLKKKLNPIVVTSGGKLKQLSRKNQTPLIQIPANLVPRMATGYIFTSIYSILKKTSIVKNRDNEIIEISKKLKPESLQKQAKTLAESLTGKVPLVYTSENLKSIGFIWKIKFNENSKIPAFNNNFPELNHNEMEGNLHKNKSELEKENLFYSLIIKDKDDHIKIKKRMDLTNQISNRKGIDSKIIKTEGESLLERVFNSIILADWTSFYLAQAYEVDPLETSTIEEFKKKMRQ